MNHLRHPLLILLFLACFATSQAQEVLPYAWQRYVEQQCDLDDSSDDMLEELLETFDRLSVSPINLNDTSCLLPQLPFITDLQRQNLRAYIAQYGPLLSAHELYVIHGFDSTIVDLLMPVCTTSPVRSPEKLTLRKVIAQARHNLVSGMGSTVEQARGYTDSLYGGNSLRLLWRYQFNYRDRIVLQLSGDKDPGESVFGQGQPYGFDFYGYHLLLNDFGPVRRAVVGQYRLQFGQGLTLWSGYGGRYAFEHSVARYAQGIRAGGAFAEYGCLRGAAATLSLSPRFDLTPFYSYTCPDASFSVEQGDTLIRSISYSGYHRTATELAKRGLLREHLWGAHLEYHTENLKAGLTAVRTLLSDSIQPQDYVYNANAFCGFDNWNLGIDAAYRLRHLLLFGEAALSASLHPAAILGLEYVANSNHRLSAVFRHYSPLYHNLHASAFGQNGTPQNEQGFCLNYHALLPWHIQANLSADVFRFPHMKYLVYAPSQGCEYRAELMRGIAKGLTLRVRYRYKERARNATSDSLPQYIVEQTFRHQLQTDLEYQAGDFRTVTRLSYAWYRGQLHKPEQGFLLYQDIQYRPRHLPLTLAARVALFDVSDYEARIYTVESDFIYQYNAAVFNDQGSRLYLLMRYDINSHWNIGAKYGITLYSNRDTCGSGYELIDSDHRQQWRIQVRLKW